MKSEVIKRSILLNGRKTSVSLENEFWSALHEIAGQRNIALSTLVEKIDQDRENINLSSAIRVFLFNHFRPSVKSKQPGDLAQSRVGIITLRARAQECREFAGLFADTEVHAIMLSVASGYDLLANRLEPTSGPED